MQKTKLMELTDKYSGGDTQLGDTQYIDAVAYMLCDMAESEFGSDFIEAIEEYLIYTQVGASRFDSLYFIFNQFVHDGLVRHLAEGGFSSIAKDLGALGAFSEKTHTDYFVAFMGIERSVKGTAMEMSSRNLQNMLFGLSSNTMFTVCQGIVNFYRDVKDQYGLFLLVKKYCQYLKKQSKDSESE